MTTTNQSNQGLNRVREKIWEVEDKALDGNYIFRGEPKCYPEVSSGLWREYRQLLGDDFNIELLQKEMIIENARRHLPGSVGNNNFGSGYSDLQILIQLQHYGGKTNLIDFTTDSRVALFFACDGFHGEKGRIILRKREDTEGLADIPFEPGEPINRVLAQRSIFVRPQKGYLSPDPDSIIEIPEDLKILILNYLQKYDGISVKTIYNDLHGFIILQKRQSISVAEFYKGVPCLSEANKAGTREERYRLFNKAITHFDKALRINPYLVSAYGNRASAYLGMDKRDLAIKELGNAIKADPYRVETYAYRGSLYYWDGNGKDKLNHVIQDYDKAITLLPDTPKFHCLRAWTWLRLKEWEKARSDFAVMNSLNYDPVRIFRANYKGVEDFEQRYHVQLPEDIKAILTQPS